MSAQPNIIVVFMDDMGYGDMSCFGSQAIRTPHMDRIAAEGAKFTQVYATSSVCSPSRAGLLTGRQPQRVGVERVLFPDDIYGLPDSERTIADELHDLGYATVMAGKWHLGCLPRHHPCRHGFDRFYGLPYSNDMQPCLLYNDTVAQEGGFDQALLTRNYADEILKFIETHRDRPFFAYLAHTMPHIPLHVEPPFRNTSRGGTYGDTIECIDFHIGRMMDALEEWGLANNTLVIVTSDNGPWFEGSAGALRARKFHTFDGGIRMPFVARCPALIPAGTVCNDVVSLMDLLPTFVSLAGGILPADRKLDGVDISAALRGGALGERPALYWYEGYRKTAMRQGKWKLHVSDRDCEREMPMLMDMEIDPYESYDVGNLYPDVLARMLKEFEVFDAEIQAGRSPLVDAARLQRPRGV